MKKQMSFWKRSVDTRGRANLDHVVGEVIGLQEAQQIRGGDKEYTPVYDTKQEARLRDPTILLDFM